MSKIKHIVYTTGLDNLKELKAFSCDKVTVLDPRSAVYVATGIAAINKEAVLVFVKSSNESRSAFSGMTEAFYRHLPVVLVTIGRELDYSQEMKDVVNSHFMVSKLDEIEALLDNAMPMHIEIDSDLENYKKDKFSISELLSSVLSEDDYLYCSVNNGLGENVFKCKVVHGGMPDCKEGSLANVLGASLARKRRRYIGLVDEMEFLHDINTLGNININDSLVFIVCCEKENPLIRDYCQALGFEYSVFVSSDLKEENLNKILNNGRKSLIAITNQ